MIICGFCQAIEIKEANITTTGECGNLLIRNGILIKTYYTEYFDGISSYPVYCLDRNKKGVDANLQYSVNIEDSIKDVRLWRIIINGYPYKTIEELGCMSKEEAFSATKQAIYCYIHGNTPEDYTGIGEAGQRTLNALKSIINNANSSNETILSNEITVKKESEGFKIDNLDRNYVSKIYSISSKANMQNYEINLTGELPENIKICDINNKEKQSFNSNEKFKILIPIINLKDNGKFNINITTKVNTKPILYGKAPNDSYQDYALTGFSYEDSIKNITDNYNKNKTTIKIIKQDMETLERIENVVFNILDKDKNILYANLKTNENGEINIEGILPGKYYIQEAQEKEGYIKNEKLHEINVNLNEIINVTINNLKEEEKDEEPEILEKYENIEIKRLPKTGI